MCVCHVYYNIIVMLSLLCNLCYVSRPSGSSIVLAVAVTYLAKEV